MAIKLGTVDVKQYLGSTEIGRAYLGTTIIHGQAPVSGGFDSTSFSAEDVDGGGIESYAYCDFQTDGTAVLSGNISTAPASPKWWGSSPPATWVSYSSTGSGNIMGGLTAGVRYQLNVVRQIGILRLVSGGNTRTFTLEFHDAASGGTLVGTKTFTASVEVA
jgi:hypothetical protein